MMDLRAAQETAAAARRQDETRRHQEEWMWSENYHLTISRLETVCALRGTRRSGLSLKKIIFTIFSLMTVMTMVTIFPMSMLMISGVVEIIIIIMCLKPAPSILRLVHHKVFG